ncbi:hypothetical protein LWI28_020184 [Acer negundo]|uniref:Uncharacterized protein n=1 Tax=Acer negundo TaxID=4023 RepID=A0AAD5P2J9_ACENE|nr:hypothetical protein LWI28_020184 [Acer negundo]
MERKVGRVPSIVFEQEDGQHGGNKLLISFQTSQIRKLVNHLGRWFFLSRLFDIEVRPEFASGDVIEKVRVLPRLLLDQLDPPVTTILADVDLFWTIWIGNCMNIQATVRKARNKIKGLLDDDGQWHVSRSSMEHVILEYFNNLFQSSNPLHSDIEKVLGSILPKLSSSMSNFLDAVFIGDEVKL